MPLKTFDSACKAKRIRNRVKAPSIAEVVELKFFYLGGTTELFSVNAKEVPEFIREHLYNSEGEKQVRMIIVFPETEKTVITRDMLLSIEKLPYDVAYPLWRKVWMFKPKFRSNWLKMRARETKVSFSGC